MQNMLWFVFKHVLHNYLMTRVNFPLFRIVQTVLLLCVEAQNTRFIPFANIEPTEKLELFTL